MIEIERTEDEITVLISGKAFEITDASDDFILVECEFSDLANQAAQSLPKGLLIEIRSQDGFGTYFFTNWS